MWIDIKSAGPHLRTGSHERAVRAAEQEKQRLASLEERFAREREADSAAALEDASILAQQPFKGPVASASASEAELRMCADYAENGADFTAGQPVEDPQVREKKLQQEADLFGLWAPEALARRLGFGNIEGVADIEDEDEEDFIAEIARALGQEPQQDEIQHDGPAPGIGTRDSEVFHTLQKQDVPSFDHLRRVQKEIRRQCGIPTMPCKSVVGNVFYMNDPRAIIAKDWANPATRKLIHIYPEIPEDGIIREIWHADKWRKTMDLDVLSPMYDAGTCNYYVNEVCCLRDGRYIIPIRWVQFRGKSTNSPSHCALQGEATVIDEKTVLVCSDDLTDNYCDLEEVGKIPKWRTPSVEAGYPNRMPNPKRAIAAGRPWYCSFVDYFSDDVSGNRSKSWNKHWNAYMTHRNLPRALCQQEFHIHFISTSPNATASEQFREFKEAVEHTEPVEVKDESGLATCVSIYVNTGPSDNPMQSEISAHIGGKGNCFCRKCRVGGTQKDKATDEGYHALFEAGVPRTKEQILEELQKQVKLACSGIIKPVKDSQTETGVKDAYTQYFIDQLISRFKEMRKDEPDRDVKEITTELIQWTVDNRDQIYSPFLKLKGFDPAKDTPIELLHTILLGIVKYIWHVTHTSWSTEEKRTYALRLQSTNTDGLSIPAIRSNYIMQYAGSLIGRQFKILAQTNIFHVRGLVTDNQFTAWRATGELAALLWVPEIRDLASYRKDLRVAVANVLDIFGKIDPSKILSKIKYHLLLHTDEDVVAIGPLVGAITEGFESFNAVFRHCSVLSNHLAPSRDIALQLANQEGLKHRLTGGWWSSGADGEWRQAGFGVRNFLLEHPVLQRLVGWSDKKSAKHGDVKFISLKRGQKERSTYFLPNTSAARAVDFGLQSSETLPGRITDILSDGDGRVLVVFEVFQVLSSRDEVYGMPVLVRRDGEEKLLITPGQNLKFKFNAQHDCHSAGCDATGVRLRMQERVESDQTENYIVHKPLDRFFINSHAFHNAHLLRATLGREVIAPIPLFPNRQEMHHELAAKLREKQVARESGTRLANVNVLKMAKERMKRRRRGRERSRGDARKRRKLLHRPELPLSPPNPW
ncbi:hypothetical protein B0H16DRAFT_1455842 [Mycena metata]|uniref:Uncharacterized protein n=1 Tax=Mycena metata TaxID=1033252 RepID=A0AAD7JD94_9AGAR|nr:hypothetical protein B0H16DRAFT_1455842 [Mycena metata]